MSSSTPKKTTDNEEIDLGVLFNAIGKGISNLFSAIGKAILFVLNTLLALAVFVRKRIVYFALACAIGLVLGGVAEKKFPKKYTATATVEPHFDSARQLYSNISYLNDLADQQDSLQLASFFGISPADANAITGIEITPFVTETRLLQEYNDYVLGLDSLVATEMAFGDYVNKLDDFDRKIHIIKAVSKKQDIFQHLLDPIVGSVADVAYFKDQQATRLENLELSDSITQISITQTDSLLSLFEEVRMVEANKEFSNGTNLYMSEKAEDNTEISLLNRKITLSKDLEDIRLAKLKARKVVDVIAAFPEVGFLETGFLKDKKVQGVMVGFLLISVFYIVLYLDAFISSKK